MKKIGCLIAILLVLLLASFLLDYYKSSACPKRFEVFLPEVHNGWGCRSICREPFEVCAHVCADKEQ